MKIDEARRLLDESITSGVRQIGFTRTSQLEYRLGIHESWLMLSFPCRIDARGFVAFTCTAGLRFDVLMEWLNGRDGVSTVAVPIHLLRPDRRFSEWHFRDHAELDVACAGLLADIKEYVCPFGEKFSGIEAFEHSLESVNPEAWFNLDADRRVVVLAAIKLSRGQKAAAVDLLQVALHDREDALPKHRFEIEKLFKRLTA